MAEEPQTKAATDAPHVVEHSGYDTREGWLSGPVKALVWIGIVAGSLFIVAAIFFSGFLVSWSVGDQSYDHMGRGPMDRCVQMGPGAMKPGGMMGPSGPMGPGCPMMQQGGMKGPGGPMRPGMMGPGCPIMPQGGMMGPGAPVGPAR